MNPLALDLCCGLGGWTVGLLATGWDVIGIDIEKQEAYPKKAFFMQSDVLKIAGPMKDNQHRKVSLVVASPPCQEFSYRHLPFGRVKNLPPPDKSIWLACERIARECNAPLVLENVIGAQKFMGKANAHYGSFYLWGEIPILLPFGNPIKGFGNDFQGLTKCGRLVNSLSSKSKKRNEWSANIAKIPFELARWVGYSFNKEAEANG